MQTRNDVYAGLLRRCFALLLDFVLFSIFFFPVTRIVKGVWLMRASDHKWNYGAYVNDPLCMIFLAIIVVYFVMMEGLFGATIGKWLVRIRVIDVGGQRPGIKRAIIRNLLRAVDALPIFSILGAVLIVTSPERTRLGDRVAGTRVVMR